MTAVVDCSHGELKEKVEGELKRKGKLARAWRKELTIQLTKKLPAKTNRGKF